MGGEVRRSRFDVRGSRSKNSLVMRLSLEEERSQRAMQRNGEPRIEDTGAQLMRVLETGSNRVGIG